MKWVPLPFFQERVWRCVAKRLLALRDARLIEAGRDAVLFTHPGGKTLTQGDLVKHLRLAFQALGLDPTTFAGRSLRRGGATALLQRGASYAEIRIAGRWKSNAVFRYTRIPVTERLRLAQRMEKDIDPSQTLPLPRGGYTARVFDDLKPPFGTRPGRVTEILKSQRAKRSRGAKGRFKRKWAGMKNSRDGKKVKAAGRKKVKAAGRKRRYQC